MRVAESERGICTHGCAAVSMAPSERGICSCGCSHVCRSMSHPAQPLGGRVAAPRSASRGRRGAFGPPHNSQEQRLGGRWQLVHGGPSPPGLRVPYNPLLPNLLYSESGSPKAAGAPLSSLRALLHSQPPENQVPRTQKGCTTALGHTARGRAYLPEAPPFVGR